MVSHQSHGGDLNCLDALHILIVWHVLLSVVMDLFSGMYLNPDLSMDLILHSTSDTVST